ncbi:MAG: hypothetical protein ABUL62_08490 [Myxococcales bacterium]
MSPLLGPILAQIVTLGVGERTELRYIAQNDKYFEAAVSPRAALSFGWKHTSLNFAYYPSFTFTPLNSHAQTLVFHNALVSSTYRWRKTTVTAIETLSIGEVNFQTQALGGAPVVGTDKPTNGTGTGGTGTGGTGIGGTGTGGTGTGGTGTGTGTTTTTGTNQVRASSRVIAYATSTSDLIVNQAVSSVFGVSADVGYVVTGSIGANASTDYPIVKGPRLLLAGNYQFTRHDVATTTLSVQYAGSSTGNNAWLALANEGWGHIIDRRTSTRFSAGISVTRNSQTDGLIFYSIFPTFNLSITRSAPLDKGALSYGTGVSSSPVLDTVRATVDPQLGFFAFLGWGKDRFAAALNANTALSLRQENSVGALSSATSSFTMSYRLGANVSADTGVRAAWQRFEGNTTVPLSYAAFIGLNFAAALPISGGR